MANITPPTDGQSSFLTLTNQTQAALTELDEYVNDVVRPALRQPHLNGQFEHAQFFLIDVPSDSPRSTRKITSKEQFLAKADHDMGTQFAGAIYNIAFGCYAVRANLLHQRLEVMRKLFEEQGDFRGSTHRTFDAVGGAYLRTEMDHQKEDLCATDPKSAESSRTWSVKEFLHDDIGHFEWFSGGIRRLREEMDVYAAEENRLKDLNSEEFADPKVIETLQHIEAIRDDKQKPVDDQITTILDGCENKITACVKPLNALLALMRQRGLIDKEEQKRFR